MQNSTIRFVRPERPIDFPYYNLGDLVAFLASRGIIRSGTIKPRKGQKWQRVVDGELYFHYATLGYIATQLKKLLVNPSDWTNKQSLFRKLYFEIDDPNQSFTGFGREEVVQYFKQITDDQNTEHNNEKTSSILRNS